MHLADIPALYIPLREAAKGKRIVLFAGLPGVGKSLFVNEFTRIAQASNRQVYLLQWDVTRAAFETEALLARYPEVAGSTHAMIRKAVGQWARAAVLDWHKRHAAEAMLVGEVPLIGNRLVELVQKRDDEVEPLLAGEQTQFFLPVPSVAVRQHIEAARARTMSTPQHEREMADAPPNVLDSLWYDLLNLAMRLGIAADTNTYTPGVYAQTYHYLLQHRRSTRLPVDVVLQVDKSVYDIAGVKGELAATAAEVSATVQALEAMYSPAEVNEAVANWYDLEDKV